MINTAIAFVFLISAIVHLYVYWLYSLEKQGYQNLMHSYNKANKERTESFNNFVELAELMQQVKEREQFYRNKCSFLEEQVKKSHNDSEEVIVDLH